MTDDEGKFSLTTFTPNDGAIAGTHVVTVTKVAAPAETVVVEPASDPASQAESIDDAMQQSALAAEQARSKQSEIPTRYADHMTSDLRIKIEPRDNNVTIELSE